MRKLLTAVVVGLVVMSGVAAQASTGQTVRRSIAESARAYASACQEIAGTDDPCCRAIATLADELARSPVQPSEQIVVHLSISPSEDKCLEARFVVESSTRVDVPCSYVVNDAGGETPEEAGKRCARVLVAFGGGNQGT
jgi:hypothetical protein